MSNNTIRIRTTPNGTDKHVKIKLDQEFDFIEILSLKITQEEAYRNFCADYGVVVGRVSINNGFGVPNARVSIFIPIDDVDKDDPIISGLYPYEIVTNKDIDGKRYNLLPKNSETDNDCFTPIGTFPNKREVLDDPEMGYVYCKYYKFTTSTNYAGDYMIFGVPIGNHTIHVDADISDIGIASQRPYDTISQGAPLQMFDSPTKFKGGTNLDRLIQVKTVNGGVNVQPFWGSVENCEIGISRIDLDLNFSITPSAIFMGGAFGDSDKNSVNKNCRPRRRMGKICEQNTTEGSIEMIRKTLDGKIEKLDVQGGRLMDENGSWAYQIPMNLDYYYTNEFGDLVLSEDPNKGIPTRANVRFKIGLDNTGGDGRLRTRANYLIPHNPKNKNEIDYEFGELTKDFSFRDLYWNKIYSVSNFISRYQSAKSLNAVTNRNFVGLKDVDDCVGDKLPAPFNRVNTVFNPLFFIICLIMKIIEFLIFIINGVLITVLNLVMVVINAIIKIICAIVGVIRRILRTVGLRRLARRLNFGFCNKSYWIPCVGSNCPSKDEADSKLYAPGCIKTGSIFGKGYQELEKREGPIFSVKLGALSDCVAFLMAKLLNLFQFDFYNDWLNGSLYYYLVKYKKRRRREKYCNYDCSGSNCNSSILIDTCYSDEKDSKSYGVREGLIKKYNNELYYAPSNKAATYKLYATEVINLGSVFECDWQGIPKIQEYLIPTTYIIPPDTDILLDDNRTVDTSGQVEIGTASNGLFFKINCLGLSSTKKQCLNIRHACEFGVDLDEIDEDDSGTLREPDHIIGSNEINSEFGKYTRDVLFLLNNNVNNVNVSLTPSPTTNFNVNNIGNYNFATSPDNGEDYVDYRGYLNSTSFSQPKHSYYFYFGTIAGSTGLDKMNSNFFTKCTKELEVEFFIRIDETTPITVTGLSNGSATFTVISGVGPFTYIISGPNGYNTSGTLIQPDTTQILNNLPEGSYTISVTDANGISITQTFEINPPTPLYASAFVSANNTSLSSPYNGEITITDVGGGSGTYTATLYNSSNVAVTITPCAANSATSNPNAPVITIPLSFCGLPLDIAPNTNPLHDGRTGYYIEVKDTSSPQQTVYIYDLNLNGVSGLNVQITSIPPTCFDGENGKITITGFGGVQPYTYETSLNNETIFDTASNDELTKGLYTIRVTDNSNPEQIVTLTSNLLPQNPEMKLTADLELLPIQCDPTKYTIFLNVINGGTDNLGRNYTAVNGNICYLQFNYDDNVDADDNLIWSPPQQFTYLPTGSFRVKVDIPSLTFFDLVRIRLSNSQGTCSSNYVEDDTEFDTQQMRLPPAVLSVNVNGVDNTKQCEPNYVTVKFNISHLSLASYRAAYIVNYEVTSIKTGLPPQVNPQGQTIVNTNQQPIRLNVPDVLGVKPDSCKVKITLVDNVGCISQPFTIGPISLPTNSINVVWSSTADGSGNIIKQYTITGGLPGVSPTYNILFGPQLTSPTGNTGFSVVPNNFTISVQGEDRVGCPFNSNSQ